MVKRHFLGPKVYKMHVHASITVKVLRGFFFHIIAENWQHLKNSVAFSSCMLELSLANK